MYILKGVFCLLTVKPKLNKILKERKMTQTELAEKTGINPPVIYRFDKSKQHQDIHLVLISRALNISIEELFEIEDFYEALDAAFPTMKVAESQSEEDNIFYSNIREELNEFLEKRITELIDEKVNKKKSD